MNSVRSSGRTLRLLPIWIHGNSPLSKSRYTDDRLIRSAAVTSATVNSCARVAGMLESTASRRPMKVLIHPLYEG